MKGRSTCSALGHERVYRFGHVVCAWGSAFSIIKTELKTVAISNGNVIPKSMWALYFIRAQGWKVKDNLLNKDITSTISLAKNGNISSGKMIKHIKIRYFFVTD